MKQVTLGVSLVVSLANAASGQTPQPSQGQRGQRLPADPRNAGGGNCSAKIKLALADRKE